jgi:hypothetical protein
MKNVLPFAFVTVSVGTPSLSLANCGSAFCTVNTDWNAQGVYTKPGGRAELRYEYVNQDTLRSGRDKVDKGPTSAEHDEVSTLNQAWFATFDYNFASGWGVSGIVPVVKRDHKHIENEEDGTRTPEEWDFTSLGDIRVAGRYQFPVGTQDPAHQRLLGLLFGVKLPTGDTTVTNGEGERAERSLQPGTGTTDAFVGAYYKVQLPPNGLSWFLQAAFTSALDSYHEYRPGNKVTADLGLTYRATDNLSLLLQLNTLWRGRDSGAQAEPDESGGTYVFISPGVSVNIGHHLQLFGLVQLPVYQYLNGLQLTADWGATAGVGYRF